MQSSLGPIFYDRNQIPYSGEVISSDSRLRVQTNQEKLLICALLTGRELCELVLNIRILSCATFYKFSCLNPLKCAFTKWRLKACNAMHASANKLVKFVTKAESSRRHLAAWMRHHEMIINSITIATVFHVRRQTRKVLHQLRAHRAHRMQALLLHAATVSRRCGRACRRSWQHWADQTQEHRRHFQLLSRERRVAAKNLAAVALHRWAALLRRRHRRCRADVRLRAAAGARVLARWSAYMFFTQRRRRAVCVAANANARRQRRALSGSYARWESFAVARRARVCAGLGRVGRRVGGWVGGWVWVGG